VQTDWAWFTDEADGYNTSQGSSNDVFDDVLPGDVISAEVYLEGVALAPLRAPPWLG
jgi:hypothetical protein